ncbi:MAG: radical SAM-associated putative lipoprotein [Proteobacteria bacterium]|nr:radical SAM-associated putative lipoprotein [Pseudomonadota bacterium]
MNDTHKKLGLIGMGVATVFTLTACIVEYGTPYAEFSLKGKVTDSDGKPIPDISVAVVDPREKWWSPKASCASDDQEFDTYARCENSTPICDDPSVQPQCEDAFGGPYCADGSDIPYCAEVWKSTTNAKGEYTLRWNEHGAWESDVESKILVIKNQDGSANGLFKDQSVSMNYSEFIRGSCKASGCGAGFTLSKDFVLERHIEQPADE